MAKKLQVKTPPEMQNKTSRSKSSQIESNSTTKSDLARLKLTLGIALVALGIILVFGRPKRLTGSDYTFANEPVIVEGFSPKESSQSLPKKIVAPELSIDLEVKEAKIVEGYWEVFEDSVAWGEGSGLPGEVGNQVIFAHAKEGLFLPLKDIKEGMRIYVLTEGSVDLSTLPPSLAEPLRQETGKEELRRSSWYSYEVTEIKEVYPYQTEVIAETEDETLTLYTCSGFADSKRLIVVAKRI